MAEATSIRMTIRLPNGTIHEFGADGPPDMALDAFRMLLGAPSGRVPLRDVFAGDDAVVEGPSSAFEDRKADAERQILSILANGPMVRARAIDRMRAAGWQDYESRDALTRLQHKHAIIVDMAHGRANTIVKLATPADQALAS